MSFADIGPIVTRGDVENQTLAHVERWMTTYLAAIERDQTPALTPRSIPEPRAYEVVNEFTRYQEDQMPYVAVISPGYAGTRPRRDGDGLLTAWWNVAVGVIVAAVDMRAAKDLAGYYGAAIRLLMLQVPDLGGWANGVEQTDEKYDDFPRVQERTMAACRLVFTIEVQEVMNVRNAPRTADGVVQPPDDPYDVGDYPTIQELPQISITRTPPDQPLEGP